MTDALYEDRYTFLIISRSALLRTANVSKDLVDKIKTHILCPIIFFFENRTAYGMVWKNIVEPDRPQISIWRMRIARWIPKDANTYNM